MGYIQYLCVRPGPNEATRHARAGAVDDGCEQLGKQEGTERVAGEGEGAGGVVCEFGCVWVRGIPCSKCSIIGKGDDMHVCMLGVSPYNSAL